MFSLHNDITFPRTSPHTHTHTPHCQQNIKRVKLVEQKNRRDERQLNMTAAETNGGAR
jgi:hypothetical protein